MIRGQTLEVHLMRLEAVKVYLLKILLLTCWKNSNVTLIIIIACLTDSNYQSNYYKFKRHNCDDHGQLCNYLNYVWGF